jgi:UDP-glucose 4-epimerase
MKILVTGGAGYIGSHTIIELQAAGHEVVVVDDLRNSAEEALRRVERITGQTVPFYRVDIRDREALEKVFAAHSFDCCIHFAGLKAVGESVRQPWEYYENNIYGTLVLTDVMRRHGCKNIVFSSSATVYGEKNPAPYNEEMETGSCTNPYGSTKFMSEQIISDAVRADPELGAVLLRYFNPIGADASGRIGEDPFGIPNNLMPIVAQFATGRREHLYVYGNDYETPDGTCRRDYIHVTDLAIAHIKALEYISGRTGCEAFNIGTGVDYSVLEVINAFEKACGKELKFEFAPRRAGDLPTSYADAHKAERLLGWKAERDLDTMCRDIWRWQSNNPMGYEK